MSAIIVKSFTGQAEAYSEKELTNERETYYSKKETRAGQWTGKGAEVLGLKGEIKKEDFSRMLRGINPTTGERFRRMTLGRIREINGEIKQVKEIAGWDMVISAPKSVSIAGLISQDERSEYVIELMPTGDKFRDETVSLNRVLLPHYFAGDPPKSIVDGLNKQRAASAIYLEYTNKLLEKCGVDVSETDETRFVQQIAKNNVSRPIVSST
jgi:hypothetical protein